MNNTNIEWTDLTWNPVTGCYHDCEYCYGKRIAHRFLSAYDRKKCIEHNRKEHATITEYGRRIWDIPSPIYDGECRKTAHPFGYEPTLHRYRLDEPAKRQKPAKIFVCSMADLFGEWVPKNWIESILKIVKQCPQHTFQFLTKNPERYYNYFADPEVPALENWWIGASASICNTAHTRSECLSFMNANTFMSFEPLHENIVEYTEWGALDWVIVGAQTGPGAKKPKKQWVENIISYCRAYDIPVFLKDNLNWPEKIQEWPEEEKQC